MKSFRFNKTGLVFGGINLLLFVAIVAFLQFLPGQGGAGSWLMLGPIIWNLPSSLLAMLLLPFKLSDFFLGTALALLGAIQWYVIGCLIDRAVCRKNR